MRPAAPETGQAAESRALAYLEDRGLRRRARNFRIRRGEIDLIMQDGDEVVFVEVRSRTLGAFGDGVDSITRAKQRRLRAAAGAWLQRQPDEPPTRFDVIALQPDNERITWIRDAFRADDC